MVVMLCLFMFQSSSVYADSDVDAVLSLALTRYHQGDSTKAILELTEASQIYVSQGQTEKQIRAWMEIGRIHQLDGRHDQVAKVLELAMTSARAAGDPRLEAWVLQAAQMLLLKDPQYDHPVFWAPFLMINNWL